VKQYRAARATPADEW